MRNLLISVLVLLSASGYTQKVRQGTVPAKADSWTMTAAIDGKPFKATSLAEPGPYGRIIGYEEEIYIGMPYWKQDMVVGKKSVFGDHNAVDLSLLKDSNFWGGHSGEMEITKVGGGWAEGKFHFTATSRTTPKKIEVTDGFFRIQVQ